MRLPSIYFDPATGDQVTYKREHPLVLPRARGHRDHPLPGSDLMRGLRASGLCPVLAGRDAPALTTFGRELSLPTRDGRLVPRRAAAERLKVDFGQGEITTVTNPWRADLLTAGHSTGIPDIDTYMAMPAPVVGLMRLAPRLPSVFDSAPWHSAVRALIRRLPPGPTDGQLAKGSSHIWGRATAPDGSVTTAVLHGPEAYWPLQGRQIRGRGPVHGADADRSAANFFARSPGSRAEALTGRQSDVLANPTELDDAVRIAHDRLAADPDLVAPGWTLYAVTADEVEFWQADRDCRHTRLRYIRNGASWSHDRL